MTGGGGMSGRGGGRAVTGGAAAPRHAGRRLGVPVAASLARAEFRVLARSPLSLVNAVLFPVAAGAGVLMLARDTGRGLGGGAAAMQVLMVLTFTTYAGATTALVARRQEFALKRMRASALSGPGIFAGLLAPYAALGIGQTALLTGVTATVGGDPPDRWWPLVLGTLAGTGAATALAVATAAVTPLPELAQLTTVPVSLGLFGGGFWLLNAGSVSPPMLAAPGVPVAELVRVAWRPDGGTVVPCLAAIAVTAALAVAAAAWRFRFDPRSAGL